MRAIEGKRAGFDFWKTDPTVGTRKVLRKQEITLILSVGHIIHNELTRTQPERRLDRVGQTPAEAAGFRLLRYGVARLRNDEAVSSPTS
jgi:hypothetical protein